ncbi:hypothetical protein E2542_SST14453 [Spatholobus suberectus]|nr:hypothetical protein E2542_SST14453 [Spatholobus suberectus]
MILAVLFANAEGNILIERFHGVPVEERLHWRSFLVKLGADNLKGVKNEELLVACHKSVYIVYTVLGDVSIYVVGKDEYDELALSEVIFVITSAVKDVCGKPPSERLFLDKYGRICLCLDEIVWKVRRHAEQFQLYKITRTRVFELFCQFTLSACLWNSSINDFHVIYVIISRHCSFTYLYDGVICFTLGPLVRHYLLLCMWWMP